MAAIPPDMMGYDRAITMFSPDGRLLQVEYAKKPVNQGTIALGIIYNDGVTLMGDKRILEKLIVPESVEKIFKIDNHLAATMSGLISDGRLLIDRARSIAQSHKITYDEEIDIKTLVKNICDHKQAYTQYGGARPFGVSLLIAGIDEGKPKLFMTEPSGIFFEYRAIAIGEESQKANKYLEDNFKTNLSKDHALKLGIKTIKEVLGDRFKSERIEAITISKETGKVEDTKKELKKYM